MTPLRIPCILALIACEACGDGGIKLEGGPTGATDSAPTGTPTGSPTDSLPTGTGPTATTSAFAGDWSGAIDGHADFGGDWETAPYCSGTIPATVSAEGDLSGTGTCVILWGMYEGLVFDVSANGPVAADGAASIHIEMTEPTDEHGWDAATVDADGDATTHAIIGRGDTRYHPTGLDPIDAFFRLTLR